MIGLSNVSLAASASAGTPWIVVAITAGAFSAAIFMARRPANTSWKIRPATATSAPEAVHDLEPRQTLWLERALLVIIAGYILFDRPFAWIHVPGTPLFVGEMVIALGLVVVLTTRTGIGSLVRASASLRMLRAFMLWGLLLLAVGILPYGLDAIRDSAIWYYGIIAFFAAILLVRRPSRVNTWMTAFARLIPIYLLWFPFAIVLHRVVGDRMYVPDSEVPIFFHRSGNMAVLSAIAIAFLWTADGDSLLFTRRQRAWLTGLATLVIGFTGLQNRGGMVASAVMIALLMFLLSKRRTEMLTMMLGIVLFFTTVGLVFDVKIELFDERDVSIEQFTKNITSIFDQDAGGQRQASTTAWRINIWEQVLDDVTNESPLMGFGPGPDLGERYDISTDPTHPLRNPHNSHVGVLARTGWVGIVLWGMLWITWMAEMQTLRRRLRYRDRARESALVTWLMLTPIPILVNAIFDPTLEGAQVAMLLWAFFGSGAALVILSQRNRFPALVGSRFREDAVAASRAEAP
ncbi:MAG: O-antigen ligase family protein [Acidimicrobiia bacterium]|nr:O-antigen ligase family protein [Acidimicrobiia bacterium]